MTNEVKISGSDLEGNTVEVSLHHRSGRVGQAGDNGFNVYTQPRIEVTPFTRPFTNPSVGTAMNQDVTFAGAATVIHAGVNSGAALTGTATGTTTSHLIDSSETFSNISVGMSVKNTTSGNEYALVTAVATNDLTLDADIFLDTETYEINPIWVGSVVAGDWNFADSGKFTITGAFNNDSAEFTNDVGQTWNTTNFSALTGKVDLDAYDVAVNDIFIQFNNAGVTVGPEMNLNDFIDTGNFAEQSFSISIGEFGFTGIINGMTLRIGRQGGTKPTVKFDDFQFESSVATQPISFQVEAVGNEVIRVDEIIFAFADAYTGIATISGDTQSHYGQYLSYNKFLGISALANGINFLRVEDGAVTVSISFKQLGDFLQAGGTINNYVSDNTNTFFSIKVQFKDPIILYAKTNDRMVLTINDNLSGLLQFTAFSRGNIEVIS